MHRTPQTWDVVLVLASQSWSIKTVKPNFIKKECVLARTYPLIIVWVLLYQLEDINEHNYTSSYIFKCIPRDSCLCMMMRLPTVSCTTRFVEDAPNVWATNTMSGNEGGLDTITLWYTPANNRDMTLGEVASVIERDTGIRVGKMTARGVVVPRSDHGNHLAADLLRDKEAFNIQCLPPCCTLL